MSETSEMWNISIKRSKATLYTAMLLMSEMSEMWNISIKDQRQHYTQQCYSCRRCQRWCLWLLRKCVQINCSYYLTSSTPLTYKHVFAHNFLNIQQIFNPKKVLESWDLGAFQPYLPSNTGYIKACQRCQRSNSYVCQRCQRWFELHCVCNAVIYLLLKMSEMVRITLWIIIQTIWIGKYFELMLRITWNFKLKPCINSN